MKLLSRIFLISFFLPTIAFTEVDLNELYIDLHQNPELSFQEEETSQKLAQILKDMGFEVTPEVGGFGVVAVFENLSLIHI